MRITLQHWEALGARMPLFHQATRPIGQLMTDQIEVSPTAKLEAGDLSTDVPCEVPLLANYRSLLKQETEGRRRAEIVQNYRWSYHSEAAIQCRAA